MCPEESPCPQAAEFSVRIVEVSERVDPDAADALWALVIGPGPGAAAGAEGDGRRPGQDAGAARDGLPAVVAQTSAEAGGSDAGR